MRPTALVTGAAVRVGRAVALELARAGFDVCVHHRTRADEAAAVADACRALGADAWTFAADLADPSGCAALVAAVAARWPRLHVLVNNASSFEPVAFEDLTLAAWDAMLAANLRAPFLLVRGLLPQLRAGAASDLGGPAEQGGCVVNLCDIGGDRPAKGYAHYSVSKAGLAMLTRAIAVELAPGVRAVGVAPGQVAWPDTYAPERRERILRRIPMGRVGTPEDVAKLVRFVACEAFYLDGAIVPVDGGLASRY